MPGPLAAPAATRVGQLWFSCLGLRVPFRVHMALQACTILLLAVFGGHVYCNSKAGWRWNARRCAACIARCVAWLQQPCCSAMCSTWLLSLWQVRLLRSRMPAGERKPPPSLPRTQLLSGPKMDAAVNSFHGWAALVASVAAPPIRVIVPGGELRHYMVPCWLPRLPLATGPQPRPACLPADINARRMAALLFSWTTLGWLLPTLLLLPKPAAAPRRARQQVTAQERGGGGLAGRAAGCVEACLRLLLCRQPHQQVRRCDRCSGGACALAWFIALVGTWGASCLVAPLLV